MTVDKIRSRIRKLADKDKAKILQGFFKTGQGQYGEGDRFLGITVPVLRKFAKECRETGVTEIVQLLRSSIHEERLLALFLLVQAYSSGDDSLKKKIYTLYIKNSRYVNNWDLVDLSAPNIVGNYLASRSREPLYALARSRELWKRRISIVGTLPFIRQNDFSDTLKIATILIGDQHDLIHKATGWMLREVGKRDQAILEKFLIGCYKKMPRTMLRYAIERFPEERRLEYLTGTVRLII